MVEFPLHSRSIDALLLYIEVNNIELIYVYEKLYTDYCGDFVSRN